jgi:hypothetical protein
MTPQQSSAPRAGSRGKLQSDAHRPPETYTPMWCHICADDVGMIAAETAAVVIQSSRRRIYRWIEDGDLHYKELASGEVMVCGRSLSKKIDELDSTTDRLSRRESA